MDDPYLNDLRGEFNSYSNQLKKLKKKILKTNSTEDQSKIIKQILLLCDCYFYNCRFRWILPIYFWI